MGPAAFVAKFVRGSYPVLVASVQKLKHILEFVHSYSREALDFYAVLVVCGLDIQIFIVLVKQVVDAFVVDLKVGNRHLNRPFYGSCRHD